MFWNSLSRISSYVFKSSWSNSKTDSEDSSEEIMDADEGVDCDKNINGLSLKGVTVPVEVLCSILKWVDEDNLVHRCRLVCKQWKGIVDEMVWEEKVGCTRKLLGPRSMVQVPWWIAYWFTKHPEGLFNCNILKNNCAQDKLKHWDIIENNGDHWKCEKEPVGTLNALPPCDEIGSCKSCFVTSFQWCGKRQVVKLSKVGLSDKIMDEIQPDFEASEWIATRFDCGGVYNLTVMLLNDEGKVIGETVSATRQLPAGDGWEKVSTKLLGPYPTGARYICFFHRGKDTQFWKGHYGIKMTGALLKPVFPKDRFLDAFSPPPDLPIDPPFQLTLD